MTECELKEEIEYCRVFARTSKYEDEIAKNPKYSYLYAKKVLGHRFLLGEKAIATDPVVSLSYAREVINGSFVEGEIAISKNRVCSLEYAINILKDRFILAEPIMLSNISRYSFNAYIRVAKTRFPLLEHMIDKCFYVEYMNIVNERIPIFENKYIDFILDYLKFSSFQYELNQQLQMALFCHTFLNGRWTELDNAIDHYNLNQKYLDSFDSYEKIMNNLGYPPRSINTKSDHTCEFVNISAFHVHLACKVCGKDKQ